MICDALVHCDRYQRVGTWKSDSQPLAQSKKTIECATGATILLRPIPCAVNMRAVRRPIRDVV